jgi:hypothetical protein
VRELGAALCLAAIRGARRSPHNREPHRRALRFLFGTRERLETLASIDHAARAERAPERASAPPPTPPEELATADHARALLAHLDTPTKGTDQ